MARYHLAMGDDTSLTSAVILDASPLIYLAKLGALEVLSNAVGSAFTTPAVLEEATRPQLAYRHPDAVEIEMALQRGVIAVLVLTERERMRARDIAGQIPGFHLGETEVLAAAIARDIPAVFFERRARRVAGALGAGLVDVTDLIVAGTPDPILREDRIVRFARLVNMRMDDVVELMARIRSDRITRGR
jgi:predicted nucleic acid-binding protein